MTVHTNKYAIFAKLTNHAINCQYTKRDFIAVMSYFNTSMLVSLKKWCIFIISKDHIVRLKVYKLKLFVLTVILTIKTM